MEYELAEGAAGGERADGRGAQSAGIDYADAMGSLGGGREFVDGASVVEKAESSSARMARMMSAARVLMETDVDAMSQEAQTGFLASVTRNMFGVADPDGTRCFGRRASGVPRENIEMLRRFAKGENTLDSEEDQAFDRADEMERFRIAEDSLSSGQKMRMWFAGDRAPSFLERAIVGAGTAVAGRTGTVPDAALEAQNEIVRRSDYETMTDDEKKSYRDATVGEYMRRRASRSQVSSILRMTRGLSDRAGDILVQAVASGDVDRASFALLDEDEQSRVVSAISAVRGEGKEGRILFKRFDFRDAEGDTNTLRLGLYDFQQSVVGLGSDLWRMAKGGAQWAYGKAVLDGSARSEYFDRIRRDNMVDAALEQAPPEEDGAFAAGFRGVAANAHWFIPYGVAAKGVGLMGKAVGAAGEFGKLSALNLARAARASNAAKGKIALEAGRLAKAEEAVASATAGKTALEIDALANASNASAEAVAYRRMVSAADGYRDALRARRAAYSKAAGDWAKGAGMFAAGEATVFSSFAMEYVSACDAAGISREDSIPVSIGVGVLNGAIESLYVPGLESSLTSEQVYRIMGRAFMESARTEGGRGLWKWTANYLRTVVPEGLRVTATEGLVEEGLQQIVTEHGKAMAEAFGKLRKEAEGRDGGAGIVDMAEAAWRSVVRTLPNDWKTYCDTVAEVLPSSVGFGVVSPFSQGGRQALRNRARRKANRTDFERRQAEFAARNEAAASMYEEWAGIAERDGRSEEAAAHREAAKTVRARTLAAPTMENGGGAASLDWDEGLVGVISRRIEAAKAVSDYWAGNEQTVRPEEGSAQEGDEARARAANFANAEAEARRILLESPAGTDTAQRIAQAFGVDVGTAEVVQSWIMAEEEMKLYSPVAKRLSGSTAVADITEENVATVLPGYVQGSFRRNDEEGTVAASFTGADGRTHTIAYVVGDMSRNIGDRIRANAKADSKFGVSYDARYSGRDGYVPWAQLSDAERLRVAWTTANGYRSGEKGSFVFTKADGTQETVDAEDVIYLANGRLADVGYAGSVGTMETARHETWHAIWRIFSASQSADDLKAFAHELGIDTGKDEEKWRAELDETVAYQVEAYASGHWVPNAVAARMDRLAETPVGRFVRTVGSWVAKDPGRVDPRTGREYDLKSFMDAYQRGELALPARGTVRARREETPGEASSVNGSSRSVNGSARSVNAPVSVSADELRAQQAEDAATAERSGSGSFSAADYTGRNAAVKESDPEYRSVWNSYHGKDGRPRGGWMKAPDGTATKLSERQWVLVRTHSFRKWFGDWLRKYEVDRAVDFAINGKPVSVISGDEFAQSGKHDLIDRVAEYFRLIGGSVYNEELGDVLLDRESVKNSVGHGLGRQKAAAFAAVPDVVRSGVVFSRSENWKGRGNNTFVLAAPIRIGNDPYVCEAIVEERTGKDNERRFYLHEVNLLSEISKTIKTPTGGVGNGDQARPLRSILAKEAHDVKSLNVSSSVGENGEPVPDDDGGFTRSKANAPDGRQNQAGVPYPSAIEEVGRTEEGGASFADDHVRFGIGSAASNGAGFRDLERGDTFQTIEKDLAGRSHVKVSNERLGMTATIGSGRKARHVSMYMKPGESPEVHKFAAKNVLELFRSARVAFSHDERKKDKPRSNKWVRAFAPFMFGDDFYVATITVQSDLESPALYSVETIETERGTVSPEGISQGNSIASGPSAPATGFKVPSLEKRISEYFTDVNDPGRDTHPAFVGTDESFSPGLMARKVEMAVDDFAGSVNAEIEEPHTGDPVDADTGLGDGGFSVSSLAMAAGFEPRFSRSRDGRATGFLGFYRDGAKAGAVTADDVLSSPLGAMMDYSVELGEMDSDRRGQVAALFAGAMNAVIRTGDLAFGQQLVGSAIFTGIKTNSDKQYGTTFDFPSICTKTQAMIDVMSENMVRLKRGLSKQEILALYRHVFDLGAAVPCPECYVFSRWIGIGGLLDNLATYQRAYGSMTADEARTVYETMADNVMARVEQWNETHDADHQLSFGKGKGRLAAEFQKKLRDLNEKIGVAVNKGETPKASDVEERDLYQGQYTTVKAMTWFENVFFADAAMTRRREDSMVPEEVLFDLNRSGEFAEGFPEAWNWRCTQGAGYGKAITPYAEASLGEGVQATGGSIAAMIKSKKAKGFRNPFLEGGKLSAKARRTFRNAIRKMRVQSFLGGQRFQSTSDARFENMTDYLIAHFEVDQMRGMVQLYTKVLSAVPFFAKAGDAVNMSLMPDLRTGGLKEEDGRLVPADTATGGASPTAAQEMRRRFPTVGTTTIGANDEHIRALVNQAWRDFVIPFHMSGGDASVETEMRAIQEGQAGRVTPVVPSDYTSTQSDKILSDEVLASEWGLTPDEIGRVHAVRAARLAILTGKGTVDMELVRSNRFLSRLYDRLNGGEWDGVRVGKGKVESHVFPNEFFDTSVKSLEESAVWTRDYLEYCRDLGFLHRFSGMVPRNGRLARVPGRDRLGNRVKLQDLFYKVDENGERTGDVEPYMWRLLVDRRMLDNDGAYQPQKVVDLSKVGMGDLETFAKNQRGVRNYDTFVQNNDHAKVEDLMREQGRTPSAPTPSALSGSGSFSAAFPALGRMSREEVVSAYVASRIALGRTDRPSDRSVNISLVKRELKAVHPDWDDARLGRETERVAREAGVLAGRIRASLDRGVSQSRILASLPETMRSAFGREMRGQARRGSAVGSYGEQAAAELAARKARVVSDAVSVQSGVAFQELENAYGLDFSKTVLGIATNPSIRRDADGNIIPANNGMRTVEEVQAGSEDAVMQDGTGTSEAGPVDARVQAAVDEIVAKSAEQRMSEKANDATNAENRRNAEGHEAETEDAMGGESGLEGSDPVAVAVQRNGVDMEDPRQMALFVVELARRWWCDNHGMAKDANPWSDPVAVQFLRRTAQGVYAKLVAEITYSRGRDTATQKINDFVHIPTVAGLTTEMTLVGAIINRNMIRETQKQMCERLDLFLRQKFGASGRFKADNEELRRRVPAELELRARFMRHAMWLTPGAAAEEAAALQRELDSAAVDFAAEGHDVDQSRVFVEITRKLNILREFGALQYRPIAQIEAAFQWWQDAEQGGATDIAQAFAEREVRTKKAAAILARAFANAGRAFAAEGRSFSELLDRYAQSHMAFTHLLRDLMRFASPSDRSEAERIVSWLELEIQKNGTRATSERRLHADALAQAVESIYGMDFAKAVADLGKVDQRFAKFMTVIDGKPVEPTRGRAIQLLASLLQVGRKVEVQDPEDPSRTVEQWVGGYHDNIVAHHREGQAAELRALLTPADLNLVAWMGRWYEQNRSELSDVCESLFGIGVYAETSNYMPVKMLLEDQGLEKGAAVGWSIFPKALMPRVRNERDFDTRQDVLGMFMQRMEEGAQWKAFANLGLELRGIFGRAELQGALVSSHGRAAKDNVLSFITDILAGAGAGARSKGDFMAYIDTVRGWAAIGALGGNLGVMLKQTTSIPAFGFEVGLANTARYMAGAFTRDGFDAMAAIWNSEERANRWNVGNSEAVANALASRDLSWFKKAWKASMITNKLGDSVPALVVGQGVYRDALARGMSPSDAMAYTWMLIERTQQSGRIENQPLFQRRFKAGNAIYQFLSTQLQYLNYELRDIRAVAADPASAEKWGRLANTLAVNHFLLSSAYYWMGQLWRSLLGQEPPEEQMKDWVVSMLMGPWGALYAAGITCTDAVNTWVKGYRFGQGGGIASLQWLSSVFVRDPHRLVSDILSSEKTSDDVLEDLGKWAADFNATFRDARKLFKYRIMGEKQR